MLFSYLTDYKDDKEQNKSDLKRLIAISLFHLHCFSFEIAAHPDCRKKKPFTDNRIVKNRYLETISNVRIHKWFAYNMDLTFKNNYL